MSTRTSSLLRRHLRRFSNHLKVLQRRHRATLAATLEDIQPDITADPVVAGLTAAPKAFKELPSARGVPVLGTLPEFLAAGGVQNLHNYISKRHQELGGVFKERLAGRELVYVSDPAAIRDVFAAEGQYPKHFIPEAWLLYNQDRRANRGLFFMEGEEWKSNRRVLNRCLLRPSSVQPHYDSFGEVADSLIQHWMTSYGGQVVPNLEKELYRWAVESLGMMVFGSRLGFLNDNTTSSPGGTSFRNSEMDKFISAIHGIFKETCAMGTFPPALARTLKLPMWTRFADSVDRALVAGQQLVQEGLRSSKDRLERGERPTSLLDQLVYEERLEEENIVRLLTDLFLAAADTTSHTAIWSLYLLGRHPEVVGRVRQEIHNATGGEGVESVKGEHLSSLPYLKGVVKEALRLYPVAPFLTRALVKDTLLGGHEVPAGTMVILSVYTTGRDPEQFAKPHQFSPERWLRETSETNDVLPTSPSPSSPSSSSLSSSSSSPSSSSSCPFPAQSRNGIASSRLHSHAFIPFGVGARSCIGRRIAETQLYLMLAKLITSSEIHSLNEVDMVMRMVGVTSQPLQLKVEPITRGKAR